MEEEFKLQLLGYFVLLILVLLGIGATWALFNWKLDISVCKERYGQHAAFSYDEKGLKMCSYIENGKRIDVYMEEEP